MLVYHVSQQSHNHCGMYKLIVLGLIAASFGTVVYNAFYCQPKAVLLYCLTNAACGALGSYLPFQKWFNQRRMKVSLLLHSSLLGLLYHLASLPLSTYNIRERAKDFQPYRIAFFLFLNFAMFAPISQLFWKYGKIKGLAFTCKSIVVGYEGDMELKRNSTILTFYIRLCFRIMFLRFSFPGMRLAWEI